MIFFFCGGHQEFVGGGGARPPLPPPPPPVATPLALCDNDEFNISLVGIKVLGNENAV